MNEIADGLAKCSVRWAKEGWNLELATCGEQIDLDRYNISHNRCIDGELMKQLWPKDKELQYYLCYGEMPSPEYYQIVEDEIGSMLGIAEVIAAKNRRGNTGVVRLKFVNCARFDNQPDAEILTPNPYGNGRLVAYPMKEEEGIF